MLFPSLDELITVTICHKNLFSLKYEFLSQNGDWFFFENFVKFIKCTFIEINGNGVWIGKRENDTISFAKRKWKYWISFDK